jgi:hypothetical protein
MVITLSSFSMSIVQPLSGGVFRVRTGLRGLPTNVFDG